MRKSYFHAMATALLLAPAAGWGADTSFAYNGCLLDEQGAKLASKQHTIVFRIYDQATGGQHLWACTNNVLLSDDGQFSVELSGKSVSGGSLGALFAENSNRPLYLGLTVDHDMGEILPRQKLISVPKAVCAADSVAALGDIAVSNAVSGSTASITGMATASSVEVSGDFKCDSIVTGSMVVGNGGDLNVKGTVSGKGVIPVGGIIVWSGSSEDIPKGWVICNGQTANGLVTPDLRDRFVVGAGKSYNPGATGGEATHKLTKGEMPRHSHRYGFPAASVALVFKRNNYFYCQKDPFDLSYSAETEPQGGDKPHENRPPYWALCYIMRVQ